MGEVYEKPRLYEVAFDYRFIGKECTFLLGALERHGEAEPDSFLELACGPGCHAMEMSRRYLRTYALDIEPAMIDYLRIRVECEGLEVQTQVGDMRSFEVPERVSLAAAMLDSGAHLLDNEGFVRHLNAVAGALRPGGVYVMELAHPRSHFGGGRTTRTSWEATRDGTRIEVTWGEATDHFDPVREVDQVTVTFAVTRPDGSSETIRNRVEQRRYTYQCIQALVARVPALELVATYGALNLDVPLDGGERAWRMVPVFRRL